MSAVNGHSGDAPATLAESRPVVLLRYRPGAAGQAARTVHVVPLPLNNENGTAGVALCGALLCPDQMETATPGEGVPCSLCLISQARVEPLLTPTTTASLADSSIGECGPQAAAVAYQEWGWPVTHNRNEVWLTLDRDTVTLLIPSPLAARVTAILRQRRCPPPMLAHPDAPEHRVVLAGEPYGVVLAWPSGVYRARGSVPLPPTTTPRGQITWVHLPQPDALQLCREIDVFSAVRTALRDPPT